jgi:hypothetical protein
MIVQKVARRQSAADRVADIRTNAPNLWILGVFDREVMRRILYSAVNDQFGGEIGGSPKVHLQPQAVVSDRDFTVNA